MLLLLRNLCCRQRAWSVSNWWRVWYTLSSELPVLNKLIKYCRKPWHCLITTFLHFKKSCFMTFCSAVSFPLALSTQLSQNAPHSSLKPHWSDDVMQTAHMSCCILPYFLMISFPTAFPRSPQECWFVEDVFLGFSNQFSSSRPSVYYSRKIFEPKHRVFWPFAISKILRMQQLVPGLASLACVLSER